MPEITCDLQDILNPTGCADRGGISKIYWTELANIDFATMAGDATKFDVTNQTILGYTMNGSGVFNKLEFNDPKAAFYDFTFTKDADVYELLISLAFKGKQVDRRNKLQAALQCCDIFLHIYGQNGTQRAVGIDWNGVSFNNIVDSLSITRHLDRGGQLGSTKAGDELDFGGQGFFAPLFATVAEASIPLS